jgi:anti-sigma factor RsiW
MRGHQRFEALAGAILLGEATPQERAVYADHTRRCTRCTHDLDAVRTEVLTTFAVARETETWRPQIRGDVAARIDRHRGGMQRWTANALGLAVILSVAFNAAVGSGAAGRAVDVLRPVVARLVPFAPMVADRSATAPTASR